MSAEAADPFDSLIFDDNGELPIRGAVKPIERVAASSGVVEFNEAIYLATYPQVAETIATGIVDAPLSHYEKIGKARSFLSSPEYLRALASGQERPGHGELSLNIDVALASPNGTVFIVGWSDDRTNPLLSLSVVQDREGWNTRGIARCRRGDVEGLLGVTPGHLYGFWTVHRLGRFAGERPSVMLRARYADGRFTQTELTPRVMPEFDLRETVLGHFASLEYLGNRDIEAAQQLDNGVGTALVTLNRSISAGIKASAHAERFGPAHTRFRASFIVCLFGKSEYFFLQNALFCTGARDVEFIYVSNSPELTELLHKEARLSERIYGLSITLVTLTGNAGFSAANNVAASFARSDRVVFINPDVFPRDDAWADTHAAIIESRPREQTMLFGAPLYYDDGSLMHGGMFFDVDQGLSVRPGEIKTSAMIRVEHYGKGAPSWSDRYTTARPVPAVTGAFISADRAWFEEIGQLTEDYLFGHYEDADLCLKSLSKGQPVWLQDVRFWHMEGKGSTRRPPHEGGSIVNRWLFTARWGATLADGLIGRKPTHALLQPAAEAAAHSVTPNAPRYAPHAASPAVSGSARPEAARTPAQQAAKSRRRV